MYLQEKRVSSSLLVIGKGSFGKVRKLVYILDVTFSQVYYLGYAGPE